MQELNFQLSQFAELKPSDDLNMLQIIFQKD